MNKKYEVNIYVGKEMTEKLEHLGELTGQSKSQLLGAMLREPTFKQTIDTLIQSIEVYYKALKKGDEK